MNLVKILKNLKQMEKKDSDLFEVLINLLERVVNGGLSNSEEVKVSYDLWGDDWFYYKSNSKGKSISGSEYYDQMREIHKKDGDNGAQKFSKEYTEVYDPTVYESHLKRLDTVCKKLNKMGFKTKMMYSKNYKKCSLKNQPQDLWLLVKW